VKEIDKNRMDREYDKMDEEDHQAEIRNNFLKAAGYYKAAATRRGKPEYVPSRIMVNANVRGDFPFNDTWITAGEYDCDSNQHGAVSVKAENGRMLGVKVDEFDVLEWAVNKNRED